MNFRPRNQMAARRAAQRKRPDRIISMLLILSLLFGNLAGFPSAAAELTSYCGKEEHVHTEECYKVAVTTEPTETEGGEETTSETTEAMEETEAAQTVILSDTPVCGKEEHTHTLKCYSNPDADVETAANWEATLPETLTGTWADDLLATVKSQVGYKESVENFIVEADGETISGYNRYGGWYSGYTQEENQPYLPWNITSLFFSIYYSNIDDFPLEETCPDWIDSLDYYGLYRAAGEYTPAEGDLVFVDTDGDGEADRVGVASEVKDNKLIAIEGDADGAVAEVTYDLPEVTAQSETVESEGTAEIDVSISTNALLLLSDGTEAPQPTVTGYADMAQAQLDAEQFDDTSATVLLNSLTAGGYIYFDAGAWNFDGVKFAIWYSNSTWSDFMEWVEGTIYRVKLPSNWNSSIGFIFARVNPNLSQPAWSTNTENNVYAQYPISTANPGFVYAEDGKNRFNVTSFNRSDKDSTQGTWDSTWYGSSGGDDGGDDSGESVTELPEPTSGKRIVYYDATLSKLSYVAADSTNYSQTMPVTGGNIYCHYWYGTDSGAGTVTMTKLSYTDGEGTWNDLYYAQIPEVSKKVIFYSSTDGGWPSETAASRTGNLELPDELTNPCFYGDSSDSAIYSPSARSGYWAEAATIRDAEAGKSADVVDITQATFTRAQDTLYLNTTFFDYYTDYELNGSNRDTYKANNGASHRNWVTFRQLNQALSSSYSTYGATYPIYVGHFQSNEHGGQTFSAISSTLNLYGYDNYRRFFSVNNSHLDEGTGTGKYDYAFQGLVKSTLSGNDVVASGSSAAFPLFDADFINGSNSKNTKLGEVYENVAFPFTKEEDSNGIEYWTFDSSKTTLAMQQDPSTNEYYLQNVGNQNKYKNVNSSSSVSDVSATYGFFPFNATSSDTYANTYNYGFGTRIDLTFRLTEDGTVKDSGGTSRNIKFNFSGDDDVWVFVDGQLALDIGGAHGQVTGEIDFGGTSTTKKATVSKVKYGGSATTEYTNRTTSFTLTGKNQDEHTLTMFYMERGMWESNMKITFNFPDENQLEVEKNVDDSDVNALFNGVFDNQKMFTFNIKNLATHFADVAANGATHDAIAWNVAESTLRKDPSNTFDRGTYCNKENALHWKAQYDDTSSVYRHKRYGVLSLPDTVDISDMTKLSFNIYVEDNSGFSLSDMYLQILDADVAIEDLIDKTLTAGNDNAMGCIGTSLSGKTYGSVSTAGNQWVKVTLDLSKMKVGTNFDKTRVRHLRFGYDYSRNIYLQGFTFEPAAKASNPTGFITQQYDVPSYGSATSGALENAAGAVYTSTLNARASYVVDQSGNFALQNGEIVNFHDQFRRGSYIRLEEVLTEQEKALYDTSWTMYENDNAVTSFGTGATVTNPSTTPSMVDVESTVVKDQRVEYYQTEDSSGKEPENAYTGGSNPGGFVFRSYANPDSTATTTKLRVKFTNKVKTADLTISKKDGTNLIDSSKTFTFVIEFYNVGGLGLENGKITTVVSLNAGGQTTITGIPVNTQYTIYELKTDSDIVLDHVSGAHTTFTPTTYSGTAGGTTYTNQDAYSVSGSIGTDNKSVKFTNVKKPTISVKATKTWLDTEGNTLQDPPNTISLCLLQRKAGDGDNAWKPYESASGYKGYQNVTFTPGYGAWEYTFTPLDVYVNYPSEQTKWEYKVVELDADGNVIAENGTITIGENDYTVTYDPDVVSGNVDENGTVTNSVETQTITNKMKSKLSVKVTKVWVNGIVDNPTSVKVMLQSSTDGNNWEKVEVIELSTTNDNWTYTFENLPDKSGTTALQYRVVEVMIDSNGEYTDVVEDGGLYNVNGIDFKVSYVNAVDTIDGNQTNWTITNTIAPKVQMLITKKAANDPNYTFQNVSFKIEKQNEDGTWAFIQNYAPDGNYVTGMTPGTYRVTETQTDSGYNLLAEPILIVIKDCGAGEYEATVNGEAATEFSVNEGALYSLKFTVYNKPKLTMPATGGVNGFEFWILGGLCIMAVPLLLYTFFWFKKGGKYLRK